MSAITAIRVDGAPLDLGRVLADVETTYGRQGVYDGPTASTARLTLTPSTALDAHAITVGSALAIDGNKSVERMLSNDTTGIGFYNGAYTLGARFTCQAAGTLTHFRYYAAAAIPYGCSLWDSGGVRWIGFQDTPPAPGWRETPFPQPIAVLPSYVLVATYLPAVAPFTYSEQRPPPLPVSGSPYLTDYAARYAIGDAFPDTDGFSNYFADVVFVPDAPKPLFRGSVTDVQIVDDDPEQGSALNVVAIGALARLGGITVGTVDYIADSWYNRVIRVLTEAGLAAGEYAVTPPAADYSVGVRPAEPTDALSMLGELAEQVGAAVFDNQAGQIVVQALEARPVGASITLPPALSRWAPTWAQRIDVVNRVTVEYDTGSTTMDDPASIARYGLNEATVAGRLWSVADADRRARTALVRRAWSRWRIEELELLAGDPDGLGLVVGGLATLPTLPQSAPAPSTTAIVEAVALSVLGDNATILVSLSDPVDSGLGLPWEDVPADVSWSEARGRWSDAYSLNSVIGAVTK